MAAANPTDIANVCKLLERLRTGEMNLIPGIASVGERKQDASTEMLQRVESVLSEHLRRMQAPLGDGGAAFPVLHQEDASGNVRAWFEQGMTLRDYFAGKAIHATAYLCGDDDPDDGESLVDMLARKAYEYADAMLKARSA